MMYVNLLSIIHSDVYLQNISESKQGPQVTVTYKQAGT